MKANRRCMGKYVGLKDGSVMATETEARGIFRDYVHYSKQFSLYLTEERPVGTTKRPAAAQPDDDRHVGRIPRGIDGLPKALGEFGCAAERVSLLKK